MTDQKMKNRNANPLPSSPLTEFLALAEHPEELFDWAEISPRISDNLWLMLLEYQPQFEKHFDWTRVEGNADLWGWRKLLQKQPRFAKHLKAQAAPTKER